MKLREHRARFKSAVMEVFLYWHKSDAQRQEDLTVACIIAGLNPDSDEDRSRLLSDIMGCRRGQYQWEMPLINKLVVKYVPSMWSRFVSIISRRFT